MKIAWITSKLSLNNDWFPSWLLITSNYNWITYIWVLISSNSPFSKFWSRWNKFESCWFLSESSLKSVNHFELRLYFMNYMWVTLIPLSITYVWITFKYVWISLESHLSTLHCANTQKTLKHFNQVSTSSNSPLGSESLSITIKITFNWVPISSNPPSSNLNDVDFSLNQVWIILNHVSALNHIEQF